MNMSVVKNELNLTCGIKGRIDCSFGAIRKSPFNTHSKKTRCHKRNGCATLLCILLSLFSNPVVSAVSVQDVYDAARENNQRHKATLLKLNSASEKLPQARSALWPSLSFDAREVLTNQRLDAPDQPFVIQGQASYSSRSFGFRFSQILYDKQAFSELDKAKLNLLLIELDIERANQDLIFDVLSAYLQVLENQEAVELAVVKNQLLDLQHKSVSARVALGALTQSDLNQVYAELRLSEIDHIEAENTLDEAIESLIILSGDSIQRPDAGSTEFAINTLPPTAWSAANHDYQNNLDFAAQKIQVRIAEKHLEQVKAQRRASVSLIVDHRTNIADGSLADAFSRDENTAAMLQMTIPLFQGGLIKSRIREAALDLDAEQLSLNGLAREVDASVRSMLKQLRSQEKKALALEAAVKASKSVLDSKKEALEVGEEAPYNVLKATVDFYEVTERANKQKYTHILHGLNLKKTLGTLSVVDIRSFTPIIRPVIFGSPLI